VLEEGQADVGQAMPHLPPRPDEGDRDHGGEPPASAPAEERWRAMKDAERWAALSDEERAAVRRGEPLPSARRDGPVVRDIPAEQEAVFDRIRSGRRGGVTDRALEALVRRGMVRRVTVTDWAHSARTAEARVDAVEIVADFAGAVLVHPLPGKRRAAA
jgi:hypothetical protein